MTFEKLVRDRIPDLIRDGGGDPRVRTVTGNPERISLLMDKLLEEAGEFRDTPTADELADILEVLEALMNALGIKRATVDTRKAQKALERGAFTEGLVLQLPEGDTP